MLTTTALTVLLASPFPSTVPGITIPNAHLVDQKLIVRGSEPGSKISELRAWGVTDVLIFKNQTTTEVDQEKAALRAQGLFAHHIPFRWKGLESPEAACGQVVQALQFLKHAKEKGWVTYFHCTVGEDRTGLLAGIWRRVEEHLSDEQTWRDEMCAHGYADGDPHKPKSVSAAIHAELTPLYHALSQKIDSGELSYATLDPRVCKGLTLAPVKRTCR